MSNTNLKNRNHINGVLTIAFLANPIFYARRVVVVVKNKPIVLIRFP